MDFDNLQYQTAVKGWLDMCRSLSSCLKMVKYEVPEGILPEGYYGVLIDVKVAGAKRVPDDTIYLGNRDISDKVARGNCVLALSEVVEGKKINTKYIFLVFGQKKFSGGFGDEDDSNNVQCQWMHYFIKGIECSTRVVATEKVNGEAAHISRRKLFGDTFFCIGSKNVHMLIRNRDDISKYKEKRFDFARRVCDTFFRTYLENPEVDVSKIQAFMTYLQTNHVTAMAEMIQPDYQHVVNLTHLKQQELRFICWTKVDFLEESTEQKSLCFIPIDAAIQQAQEYGLQTVKYHVMQISENAALEMEEYMAKIRKEHGYEGKVLYFIDQDGFTIGLIKKKTAWYILLRALREKVAAFNPFRSWDFLAGKKRKIGKRIDEIKTWLGLSSELANGWTELSTDFASWLHLNIDQFSDIRSNFPHIFEQFLMENPQQKQQYEQLLNSAQTGLA